MPKQVGLIKVRGAVEDLTFYETQDGLIAKKRNRTVANRLNNPNFLQVKLNTMEFGTGGNAGRLFREAFTTEINKAADNRMISRLTQSMITTLKTDPVNDWGYRQVQGGDMQLLVNFNFNNASPFNATVKIKPEYTINRVTGEVSVTIPALVPQESIAAPGTGVTNYRFFAAAAAIDFENDTSSSTRQNSANLVYGTDLGTATTLTLPLTPNSPLPIFLVLGVQFLTVVNNKPYPTSKKESSLVILAVDNQ